MQHHLQWRRWFREQWLTHKVDGSSRISREASFIEHSMAGNDELLVHWIPKVPGLHSFRISNKDALLGVRLECFALAFAYQDVG